MNFKSKIIDVVHGVLNDIQVKKCWTKDDGGVIDLRKNYSCECLSIINHNLSL